MFRTAVVVCLLMVLASCGLEHRPRAVGSDAVVTPPSTAVVSEATTEFRAVDLTTGVLAFVPTEVSWTVVVDEAPTGHSVRILDATAQVSVLAQATVTSQTAEQLCGRALEPLAKMASGDPVPIPATVQPPARVHAFSCSVTGVVAEDTPATPIDVRVDVAVDTVDEMGYVQMTRVAQSTAAEDRARVAETAAKMFELAVQAMG